jgi:isopenicillin-N epimerase
MQNDVRDLFLLDPDVIFLNHGSFGACPAPVFDVYQRWQRELEHQPVEFLGRRAESLLDEARAPLAALINADARDVIFVLNATTGANIAARSVDLRPGDEVLTTDHEYGACDMTWEHICTERGAVYVRQPVPLPVTDEGAFTETIWGGVTDRTRVLFLSHITSPTGLIFPIAELIRRAREAEIVTMIDGAHVPGHVDLDLRALDPDFYTGNCHKWLCAPKGAAFLYARHEHHDRVPPPVISWGYQPGESFARRVEGQGTRDLAAWLSVPAAIAFQRDHDWAEVRRRCHDLAVETRARINTLTGMKPIAPEGWLGQMATIALPPCDVMALKTKIYGAHRIEFPAIVWNDQPFIRVSFQGYNTRADADALIMALAECL